MHPTDIYLIERGKPPEQATEQAEQPKHGLSAYELAVQAGFAGTLEAWLLSLKGAPGAEGQRGEQGLPGRDGTNGENGEPGRDGKDGKDGSDGLSAYTLAQQSGYVGTMQEWLLSLKGDAADPSEIAAITQQLQGLPHYKEFQAAYVPRSGFVGNFANSSLVTINFERPFSETPMVKAVLHIQDTVPRIIYTQNQTNTGFQIATNYAASLIGVWYEASVLNTNKSA